MKKIINAFKSNKKRDEVIKSYMLLLEQWGVPVEEKTVFGEYGSTYINIAGDKANPPLLLFHGVGDNSALMWIFNAKYLSKYFRVYAIDALGGAGRSVSNINYATGFNTLKWLKSILDELKIDKAYAAGVSYGSLLVQMLLCYDPERIIKGVCMAGGSASAQFSKKSSVLEKMKIFLPEALFPSKSNCIKLVRKLSGINVEAFINNKILFEHWCLLLKYFNNMSMMKHKVEPIKQEDFIINKNNCLYIIGDMDKLAYSDESIRALKEPDLNYIIIKNAGHPVNHEYPDKVNSLIVDFLLS